MVCLSEVATAMRAWTLSRMGPPAVPQQHVCLPQPRVAAAAAAAPAESRLQADRGQRNTSATAPAAAAPDERQPDVTQQAPHGNSLQADSGQRSSQDRQPSPAPPADGAQQQHVIQRQRQRRRGGRGKGKKARRAAAAESAAEADTAHDAGQAVGSREQPAKRSGSGVLHRTTAEQDAIDPSIWLCMSDAEEDAAAEAPPAPSAVAAAVLNDVMPDAAAVSTAHGADGAELDEYMCVACWDNMQVRDSNAASQ